MPVGQLPSCEAEARHRILRMLVLFSFGGFILLLFFFFSDVFLYSKLK